MSSMYQSIGVTPSLSSSDSDPQQTRGMTGLKRVLCTSALYVCFAMSIAVTMRSPDVSSTVSSISLYGSSECPVVRLKQ